ncbi:unnamed protein product, partial [Amoebophrya sp. A120]|eukprot:GSA120T00006262001.1
MADPQANAEGEPEKDKNGCWFIPGVSLPSTAFAVGEQVQPPGHKQAKGKY